MAALFRFGPHWRWLVGRAIDPDRMTKVPDFAVVILAAGQGTRMRSDTHKVLHPIASRPLLLHLLDSVDGIGARRRIVVVGKGRDQVERALDGRDVAVAHQAEQKGTGHARVGSIRSPLSRSCSHTGALHSNSSSPPQMSLTSTSSRPRSSSIRPTSAATFVAAAMNPVTGVGAPS